MRSFVFSWVAGIDRDGVRVLGGLGLRAAGGAGGSTVWASGPPGRGGAASERAERPERRAETAFRAAGNAG